MVVDVKKTVWALVTKKLFMTLTDMTFEGLAEIRC